MKKNFLGIMLATAAVLFLHYGCSTSDPAPAPPTPTSIAVTAQATAVSTTGFTLSFDVAVPELTADNFVMTPKVTSVTPDASNKIYTVVTSALAAGSSFTVSFKKDGYAFSPETLTISVPKAGDVAVTATVSNPTTTGFTLKFTAAVAGFVGTNIAINGVTITSATAADTTNKIYTVVTSPLTAGTTYNATLSKTGFSFLPQPVKIDVPATAVTAKVSNPTTAGFTLTFDKVVAGFAKTDIVINGVTITSATADTTNKIYTVVTSALTAGTTYTATLTKAGYSFTPQSVSIVVPAAAVTPVVASITNPSLTGFTLTFDPAVAGLVGTEITISGGATITSATPNTGNTAYTVVTSTLTAGTSYAVTLTKTGYTFTGTLTFTVIDPAVTPPTAPTMLIAQWASAAATADLILSWDTVTGATSYKVYKDAVLVATVTTNTSTITGASATAVYTVSAANAGGESAKASVFSSMMLVPAGTFDMGQVSISEAIPVHSVTLTKAYYMSKTEVTFDQYDAFCDATTGKQKPSDNGWGRGTRPVINVTWDDAVAYAQWISGKTGKTYSLPTEAEWEYACRAGTTTRYNTGDALTTAQANFGSAQTVAVGTYPANAWGLYDMHGNVWEWCSDWYGAYGSEAQTDPTGPNTGNGRVTRGGSWDFPAENCRSVSRASNTPGYGYNNLGFRVVVPQ